MLLKTLVVLCMFLNISLGSLMEDSDSENQQSRYKEIIGKLGDPKLKSMFLKQTGPALALPEPSPRMFPLEMPSGTPSGDKTLHPRAFKSSDGSSPGSLVNDWRGRRQK